LTNKHGFSLVQSVLESNNSPYRRQSHGRLYRWYEPRRNGWRFCAAWAIPGYMVFRKNGSNGLNAFPTAQQKQGNR